MKGQLHLPSAGPSNSAELLRWGEYVITFVPGRDETVVSNSKFLDTFALFHDSPNLHLYIFFYKNLIVTSKLKIVRAVFTIFSDI